jgi:sugar-specific transcriptional regulator TrmB
MIETLKNLQILGFSENEAKTIFALFDGHLLSVPEIAKLAGIPRSSAYDILKSFTKDGICNEIQTSSVSKYEIIDPKVVQDKFEKEIHTNFKTRLAKLNESFEALIPKFKAKEQEKDKVDVELIKGFNKHRVSKFMQLWKDSSKELLLMNKLEGYVDSKVDEQSVNFIKNGGIIKTIYEVNYSFKIKFQDKWKEVTPIALAELCIEFESNGIQVRLAKSIHQNIAIFDRNITYSSLVDPTMPRYNRSDIIVKNSNYAKAMTDYFNYCWSQAVTISEFKNKLNLV